jgi:type IV secretion system protein TrbE
MLLPEFKKLTKKPDRTLGFPDLLNYAAFVAPGTILLKDGALLAGFIYAGPDLNSSSPDELASLTHHVNAALARFGDGWMLNVDLIRHESVGYPDNGEFPDPTTRLIDRERQIHYTAERQHFETRFALTTTFRPSPDLHRKAVRLFFSDSGAATDWSRILDSFQQNLAEFQDALSASLRVERMDDASLLTHLNACITGRLINVRPPKFANYLDAVLGNHRFVTGFKPALGGRHIRIVAPAGFPLDSHAEVTAFLNELAIPYRWSTRAIFLDPQTAVRELSVWRRNWFQKRLGFGGILKETFGSGTTAAFQNQHALQMAADADSAVTEAQAALVRYCYYTTAVVLTEDDPATADANAQEVLKQFQHHGFDARIEHINANEAYLGSLPGHGHFNVRRPLMHSQNLADLLPLTSAWPGEETNPCPFYSEKSPSLCYAATGGSTPFRLNLHVGDVGHTLVFGPTGSGKSTLLGLLMAQFFRYPNAQVFSFDKGYSAYVLTSAAGGIHYDLGADEIPFCPLARVDDEAERLWAHEWLDGLLRLQSIALMPEHRKALWRALELLSQAPARARTITDLINTVQERILRDGLGPYSVAGPMGRFLDAESDALADSRFQTFEIESLMAMGERVLLPVVTYLFRAIDRRLDGRPTLIVLDEAWVMLANSVFGEKIEEWLRTLRKKNAAVVLATQSLTEVANSPVRDVILESCPTKILLPNPEARNPATSELYRKLGLTDRQIEIIAEAVPKRHYYFASPLGRRLFDLAVEPVTLAFIGAGSKQEILTAKRMQRDHGAIWPCQWLKTRELTEWADYWLKLAEQLRPSRVTAEQPLGDRLFSEDKSWNGARLA